MRVYIAIFSSPILPLGSDGGGRSVSESISTTGGTNVSGSFELLRVLNIVSYAISLRINRMRSWIDGVGTLLCLFLRKF